MGFVNYNRIEVGDSRAVSGVNAITSKISTESANIERLNLGEGGIEARNLVTYASRRTAYVSESGESTLSNTSFSVLTINSTQMLFDYSTSWGADVVLTDQDAIRICASAQIHTARENVEMTIFTSIGGVGTYNSGATRRLGVFVGSGSFPMSITTITWIQPTLGNTSTVEQFGMAAKIDTSVNYTVGNACITATLYRKIGRIS